MPNLTKSPAFSLLAGNSLRRAVRTRLHPPPTSPKNQSFGRDSRPSPAYTARFARFSHRKGRERILFSSKSDPNGVNSLFAISAVPFRIYRKLGVGRNPRESCQHGDLSPLSDSSTVPQNSDFKESAVAVSSSKSAIQHQASISPCHMGAFFGTKRAPGRSRIELPRNEIAHPD